MDHPKQRRPGGAASPGKNGGGGKGGKAGAGGSGGGKKPIKVVYISNPMRVKTNAEGFRALVQELTGRHADPSKYSADDDAAAAARARQEFSPEGSAAAPGPAAAPEFAPAAFGDGEGDEEEEDDIFRSQLLDIFSPSTLF